MSVYRSMKNDLIEEYIIRFLSRRERPEDVEKLKQWLSEDPSNRDKLKDWLEVWDAAELLQNKEKYDGEKAYRKFLRYLKEAESQSSTDKTVKSQLAPVSKPLHPTLLRTISRIAAIFILSFSLGAGSLFYYMNKREAIEIAYVETIIPLGAKSEIVLPDGTNVWLNAGSKLRYPTDYGKESRTIYLEGEGYFKVAKQKDKTFAVQTSLMTVYALGTEFNVKAYQEEETIETTLISGKVAISNNTAHSDVGEPVILTPGQKLSLSVSDTHPRITQLSPEIASAEASWKNKNWRIEKESLKSLAVKLERRYDVKIKVDDSLLEYRFTSTLKDESLEQVLTAMQHSSPILYKVEGKQVTLYADPGKIK